MARRVFFSFHYDDVKSFRANVVRNHWLTKEDRQDAGFFDTSIWEDAKLHGDDSVKRLINKNLEGTSVTCALIGTSTYQRRWVRYEIMKSYDRGNPLIGVHINSIKDKNQQTKYLGSNPFAYLGFIVSDDGTKFTYYEYTDDKWIKYLDLPSKAVSNIDRKHWGNGFQLSSWVKSYNWIDDDGYNNFSNWIKDLEK